MIAWLCENHEIIRNLSVTVSALLAACAFAFNAWEKNKENRLNRFNTYLKFEERLNSDKDFQRFITLLEEDNPELVKIDVSAKFRYLGFLEEVAIASDSRLISKQLAFYMFGYYAIRANESEHFNNLQNNGEINWDAVYWSVAKRFVIEMKKIEAKQIAKKSSSKVKF